MTYINRRLDKLEVIAECSKHNVAIVEQIPTGYIFLGVEYSPSELERVLKARDVTTVIVNDVPRS